MKIFKIVVFIVFVLLVILFVAVFIIINTIDIKKYKPQIVQQASSALGRDVQIADLDLAFSLRQGIALNIRGLSIADNPAFSSEQMLAIEHVGLDVDILAYLTQHKIVITRAYVQSPQINVIRNSAGQLNVQELGQPNLAAASPGSKPATAGTPAPEPATNTQKPMNIPDVVVRSVIVEKATIHYRDQLFQPEVRLDVSDIDLRVTDFSLSRMFKFALQMNVLSDKRNLQIEGSGQLSLPEAKFESPDIKVSFDFSGVSPAKVNQSLPMVKGFLKEGSTIKGKGQCTVHQLVAGAQGLEKLVAEVQLTNGQVSLSQLPKDVENINVNLDTTEQDLLIKQMSLQFAGGSVGAQGQVLDYLKTQRFDGIVAVQKIPIAELVPADKQAIKVQGTLNGKYSIKGAGFAPNVVLKTLAGEGTMEVNDGEIIDMNILRMALDKISMIPQLVDRVTAALPPQYKEILERKNTVIKIAKTDTKIADGLITIREAMLETDGFLVSADGTVGLDQSVNLKASLFIAKDLSASMTAAVEELKYLLEDDGRIRIPLKSYSGGLADFKIFPDLEYLGKRILKNKGKEEIQRLLGKAMGTKEGTSGQEQNSGQPNSSGQPVRPEQEIIGNILDAIFK